MKKLLAILLAVNIVLFSFIACDGTSTDSGNSSGSSGGGGGGGGGSFKPHTHTYGEWECDEFKHWREYTCGCDLEAELGSHVNDDGDELCDVCGYDVGLKEDYLLYCLYFYVNEYGSHTQTQISLDEIDLSVLIEILDSLSYFYDYEGSSPTKIQYCVRHYDTETDEYFVTGKEQYLDLSGNLTNKHADVTYSIDYVNSLVTRRYTTANGKAESYATLTLEQLNAVKEAFKPVADILEPHN